MDKKYSKLWIIVMNNFIVDYTSQKLLVEETAVQYGCQTHQINFEDRISDKYSFRHLQFEKP